MATSIIHYFAIVEEMGGDFMQDASLLIVEDEESILDILSYALKKEGYRIHTATTGERACQLFYGMDIDLIILDVMLPDTTGFDICKKISATSNVPILMLTARDDIVDKVLGLELGADDYLTKPFDIREVVARVKTLLRRQQKGKMTKYIEITDAIKIEPSAYTVYKDGEIVSFKPKEYELLLLLAQHPNRVFSREEILDLIWGINFDGGLRTVDVHIQRIRKKLDPTMIQTVFGAGYKLKG